MAAIRRDARAGMSARAIGAQVPGRPADGRQGHGVGWPEPREKPLPRRSKLDPFKPTLDEMLRADLDAPRKQRHTITRIYRRLTDEQHMQDVSYPWSVLTSPSASRRSALRRGRGQAEVFIAQSHRPGAEAEVDFGEIVVRLSGELVFCSLFCLRLSFSGKAVHRVSLSGGKERTKEPVAPPPPGTPAGWPVIPGT